ncbi:signal peptidase II [Paraglaciecola sp. 2405UD69-4]|uniref:signal peptidase II n=1 Tax=Paraglaciecola sp. 2405UD69-4 TaxID=3391836 RepID=UPI0039C985B6
MSMIKRLILLVTITIASVGIDQGTKLFAAENLPKYEMTSYLADTLRIGYVENTGAFLGLGSDLPDSVRFWIFVGAVGVILLALLIYIIRTTTQTAFGVCALSLIFSGGISNFYDRAMNNGAVIDFLNIGVGTFRTGIFNVADMAIMLGVFLLLFAKEKKDPQVKGA